MKAVRIHTPGDPKQLVYEDISKPSPKISETLIQVHAVGITPSELLWSAYAEEHLPMVIGHDFSRIIEGVGAEVEQVKIGDSVYGPADFWRDGAAAEYVVVKASYLAHKPEASVISRQLQYPLRRSPAGRRYSIMPVWSLANESLSMVLPEGWGVLPFSLHTGRELT